MNENIIKSILIIDDSLPFLNIFKKLLSIIIPDAKVTIKSTYSEGLAAVLEHNDYNLVFVDFRFPTGENGTELLEAAREELKDKAVFLVTSEPTPSNIEKAKVNGAIDVLAKPPTKSLLKNSIERANQLLLRKLPT